MTASSETGDDKRLYDSFATNIGTLPMKAVMSRSGLEVFEAIIKGELPAPPMAKTLNFALTSVQKGEVVFEGIPLEDFYNPLGSIHGGWAAAILDSALGCAVHTTLEAGQGYTTVEFKVNLVRPLFKDTGRVTCKGRVVHAGRTIATSEAQLFSPEGKLLAHATETCAIFPLKKG